MSLLTLKEIHVAFGPQVVLDRVDLTVHPGDRIGIVGPNGAGKSTLFAVILGRVVPSIGQVHLARGLRTGHLPQEVTAAEHVTLGEHLRSAFASTDQLADAINRVGEQLADAALADPTHQPGLLKHLARLQAELDAAGGYHYESRIGEVRAGLQLDDIELDRPMTSLSGGQLSRAALARLLLTEPDLLLLDEPTNHLDLSATEWLEQFLASFGGAMMVISHDRYLLDKVAEKIVEVSSGGAGRPADVRLYSMRFRDYMTTRQIQQLQQQRQYEQQQEFIAKERDFIARFHAGQRAKEARGRQTRLQRRIKSGDLATERVRQDQPLSFEFRVEQPGGQMIVRCGELCKRYGDRVLFDRFDLEISRGQKVGICGPNGVGKSTLLKMLLGEVGPDSGRARLMENLDVGYLDQHLAVMDENLDVLGEARKARPDIQPARLRGLLAKFGFSAEDIAKQVGSLSGGEHTRLAMAMMVLAGHQVLLMDEPTNHLDMSAREALEDALREYPGTIIVVSHDRYFLDRVADRLLVMGRQGRHEYHLGNYSSYQRALAERARAAEHEAADERRRTRRSAQRSADKRAPASGGSARPDITVDWPEELKPLAKLSVAKLETRIIELEARLEELHAQFADNSLYDAPSGGQPARLAEIGKQVAQIQKELQLYNAAWQRRAQ